MKRTTEWKDLLFPVMDYRQVVIKDKTHTALHNQHIKHFSQTVGTRFTIDPLNQLGEYAETKMREDFRKGELNIEELNIDNTTKEFLKEL